ncbi:MAG: TrkA family potassium uptake protein, partial [Desulfobacterales bacterium]
LFLCGDAADEDNLQRVGIQHAVGLVAVLATDADNVFLILTARQLNRDLYIVSRAGQERAKAKLRAAGANRVESPYDMGALSMAQRILRPTVTNFLDLAYGDSREDIQMEEIPVDAKSSLVNLTLKDSGIRQQFNSIIIAIKEEGGNMLFNPSFESQLRAGDTVIAVGEIANLKKLEKVLSPDLV